MSAPAQYSKTGARLAPLRVCPHHGQSFRNWNAGARGPCCRQEDATFGVEPEPLGWEQPGGQLLAYQRLLATRYVASAEMVAARRVARSSFTDPGVDHV